MGVNIFRQALHSRFIQAILVIAILGITVSVGTGLYLRSHRRYLVTPKAAGATTFTLKGQLQTINPKLNQVTLFVYTGVNWADRWQGTTTAVYIAPSARLLNLKNQTVKLTDFKPNTTVSVTGAISGKEPVVSYMQIVQ